MSFEIKQNYINELESLIKAGNTRAYIKSISGLHLADIAEVVDSLSFDAASKLLHELDKDTVAEVLLELDEDLRAKVLEDYSGEKIAVELVGNLDSDDAADLINELPDEKKNKVLSNIEDPEQAKSIAGLLVYTENTAGALMATELIKVNQNWKVLECVQEMRKQAENVEHIHFIYVIDDDDRLLGTLSLKKLLTTSTETPIAGIYNDKIQNVRATANAEDVARAMEKYDLVVMPVVDSLGHLLGRITIDDVVDLIRDETKEDYNLASGLVEDVEYDDSIVTITRARLPWLLIGLFGGLAAAFVIGRFEETSDNLPKMIFFIPLIAAMGGNVGVQSSAIIVQGLASKSLMGGVIKRLLKELKVALLNGVICGSLVIGAGIFLGYEVDLCLIVSVALVAVICVSALVGTFVPLALDYYKVDPALATGPFITTMNDILGLFIYFSIGKVLLGF